MTQPAQQTSFIPAEAEQPLTRTRLIVPTEPMSRLRDGGADYISDFITPTEETDLLAAVDAATWQADLQRRVQHYGYRYDYTKRNINADNRLGGLPYWVGEITNRLMEKKIFSSKPDQLIVNEYEPGQGIAPHTDRDCFGPVAASLSFGGDCMMRMMPCGKNTPVAFNQDEFDLVLLRRSLVVFQGNSRDVWRHGIAPRRSDQQGGRKISRQRRVSLTFRTVEN